MARRRKGNDLLDVVGDGIALLPKKYQLPAAGVVMLGLGLVVLYVMAPIIKLNGLVLPPPLGWMVDMMAPNQKALITTPATETDVEAD